MFYEIHLKPAAPRFQIFRRFEYPAEVSRLARVNDTVEMGRLVLLDAVFGGRNDTDVDVKLLEYESLLREAFAAGLPPRGDGGGSPPPVKWTVLKAVFFSSTVLTTIGEPFLF